MNPFTRGLRPLALLVPLTAIGFVPSASIAATGSPDKLQVLVNETVAQLQLAYRQHPDERTRRQEQLAAVIEAWRAAPRSEANNERLANWLRAAILNSMPGSKEPLPAAPSFAAVVKAEPQREIHEAPAEPKADAKEPAAQAKKTPVEPTTVEKPVEKQTPPEAVAKPMRENEVDPFRDDPDPASDVE